MAKVFCIDVGRCSGCYNCQFACKDEHCGNEWMPYAKMQPMTGQFWLKMEEHINGTRPKVKMHFIPRLCNHCADPACVKACTNGAVYKRDDGLVIIDPVKAKGQKQLADACPYGAIYWNEELEIPQKCTGCAHLLEDGQTPRCVDVCHTGAIQFGEEDDFKDFISGATVFNPESGCGPHVYYRNIPGQFIAGTIYDPIEEVVIKKAVCTLTGGNEQRKVYTDTFGDFWFKDLSKGSYTLEIVAEGFKTIIFKDLDVSEKCINLGDLPMEKI